jgi:hypothetical protein
VSLSFWKPPVSGYAFRPGQSKELHISHMNLIPMKWALDRTGFSVISPRERSPNERKGSFPGRR